MGKLLKNEWRRYRTSVLILMSCIGCAAVLLLLIVLCVVYTINHGSQSALWTVGNAGTLGILLVLIRLIPNGAAVYAVLSYATDVGKRGMIFLTPCPAWKVILSKLIFSMGTYAVLEVLSQIAVYGVGYIGRLSGNTWTLEQDMLQSMLSLDSVWEEFTSFLDTMVSLLLLLLTVMGSIALSRYAAMSFGVQVILTIVFFQLIWLIQGLVWLLLYVLHVDTSDLLTCGIHIFYSILLYAITVCLTERKVDMA